MAVPVAATAPAVVVAVMAAAVTAAALVAVVVDTAVAAAAVPVVAEAARAVAAVAVTAAKPACYWGLQQGPRQPIRGAQAPFLFERCGRECGATGESGWTR